MSRVRSLQKAMVPRFLALAAAPSPPQGRSEPFPENIKKLAALGFPADGIDHETGLPDDLYRNSTGLDY